VTVDVRAVDRYALVAEVGARERRSRAARALVVFQTKRGLVALGHFRAGAVQHVERGEHFHAVVMPGNSRPVYCGGNGTVSEKIVGVKPGLLCFTSEKQNAIIRKIRLIALPI